MRYYSYLNTAVKVLNSHDGAQPFAGFLKSFFASDKKYGSKDRKQIGHLCYCYFRLGHALKLLPTEERILAGLFLCSSEPHPLLAELRPEWNEKISIPASEKLGILQASAEDIFPWTESLSEGIDAASFCFSFFIQPDLFLRIRPGKNQTVKEKLDNAGIIYSIHDENCVALANATRIEAILSVNKDAVVQDYNSQRIGSFLTLIKDNLPSGLIPALWDCCAASGGKSILAKDIFDGINLTVSDIRTSILHNLKTRFNEAGIQQYKSFQADLTKYSAKQDLYDIVICDAPCSGSGTWGRTPEELYYFNKSEIEKFSLLQKRIVSNVLPSVKAGGYFLYITCSVFSKENEVVAEHIVQAGYSLIKKELLKGYEMKADTMYAALFEKL